MLSKVRAVDRLDFLLDKLLFRRLRGVTGWSCGPSRGKVQK